MTEDESGSYSVLRRALRHAVVDGDSWTLRTYAVLGTLVAVFTAILFVLAFPSWIIESDAGAIDRVARAFLGLVGLLLIAPMLLPVVFVYRRARQDRSQRQRAFGLAGYGYLLSLYVALLASAPADLQSEPPTVLAPVVDVLYAAPAVTGLLFPLLGIGLVLGVEYGTDR